MELIRLDSGQVPPEIVARVAQVLRAGGLVAFPTETVYGIGALAESEAAIQRLYVTKDRPHRKPLTFHVASVEDVRRWIDPIPPMGAKLIEKYWPGPLTLVFEREGADAVGIRFPANAIAQELIRAVEAPIVATSANPSGEEPAVTGEDVVRYFPASLDVVIDSGPTELRQASTVVRIAKHHWEMLREGIIDESLIADHLAETLLFVCTGNTCRSVMAEHLCRRMLTQRFDVPDEKLLQFGYRVKSAGTLAFPGGAASAHTIDVMRAFGCDAARHVTHSLTPEWIAEADRIFVMTRDQKKLVESLAPEAAEKIFLLNPSGRDIEDPFGRSQEWYLRVAQEIDESLRKIERVGS
ncbi:MAG: threonylcarbamoyl-AMP synthase [Planctomycetes bacterium]|nr:threonylcarbamoyl-AMP synthase [Planctomycetota bacterium]